MRGAAAADTGRLLADLSDERDADALAVGRRGVSRNEAMLLGSVSEAAVAPPTGRCSSCPGRRPERRGVAAGGIGERSDKTGAGPRTPSRRAPEQAQLRAAADQIALYGAPAQREMGRHEGVALVTIPQNQREAAPPPTGSRAHER